MNYFDYRRYFEDIITLLESISDTLSFIQDNGRYILYSILFAFFVLFGINLIKKRWLDL